MTSKRYFFSLFFFISHLLIGQVGMGTNAPDSSAALDLSSTSKGFYPPRMTYTQMTSIVNPTVGLMVYCTDCEPESIYYYEGGYFLNSHRQAVSGNLDSFDGSSLNHSGGNLDSSTPYFESDGITTSINLSGWSGETHNPISFSSTGRLGFTATLISLTTGTVRGVLEDGTIPASQLRASRSGASAASGGRLSSGRNYWAPGTRSQSEWFQVDLGQVETVIGVATQGRSGSAQWVSSYKIQYSTNGTFTDYNGGEVLRANANATTVVRNDFNSAITARYIRFNPRTWSFNIAARFEVYILAPGVATFQITGKAESTSGSDATFTASIGGQTVRFSRIIN